MSSEKVLVDRKQLLNLLSELEAMQKEMQAIQREIEAMKKKP